MSVRPLARSITAPATSTAVSAGPRDPGACVLGRRDLHLTSQEPECAGPVELQQGSRPQQDLHAVVELQLHGVRPTLAGLDLVPWLQGHPGPGQGPALAVPRAHLCDPLAIRDLAYERVLAECDLSVRGGEAQDVVGHGGRRELHLAIVNLQGGTVGRRRSRQGF